MVLNISRLQRWRLLSLHPYSIRQPLLLPEITLTNKSVVHKPLSQALSSESVCVGCGAVRPALEPWESAEPRCLRGAWKKARLTYGHQPASRSQSLRCWHKGPMNGTAQVAGREAMPGSRIRAPAYQRPSHCHWGCLTNQQQRRMSIPTAPSRVSAGTLVEG